MNTKELSEALYKVLSANPSMGTGISMHDRVMALFADWIRDNVPSGKIKRWAVITVDTANNGERDHKPRTLGTFKTEEEAKNFALEDMRECLDEKAEQFADDPSSNDFVMDEAAMKVHDSIDANVCEWNVEEIEIDL